MKNKILRFLLAVVISLGIWMYVVMVVSPESETVIRGIPVMLDGENTLAARDLIIVSNKSFTADLKLFGNRVDLNKLTASNVTITADLSKIVEPGEHQVRYTITYPGVVQSGNIDALERDPQFITVVVAERAWKEVPVKVDYGNTSVPEGYGVDLQNMSLDYTSIIVTGPKETLEHVHYAKINVDLTNQVSTIVGSFQPILCDTQGRPLSENEEIPYADKLSTNVNAIKVTIDVYKIKEVPLVVEVIDGGGLTVQDIELKQSMQTIMVSGSDALLQNLERIVVGKIRLAELLENSMLEFDIVMPNGVNNVTGVQDLTVEVTLLQQLEIREFKLTTFQKENVPGRVVEMKTQSLTVKIRGTKAALDALSVEDIIAEVDVSNVANMPNKTTATLKVTIRLPDGSTAGAVGEYAVVVEIMEVVAVG